MSGHLVVYELGKAYRSFRSEWLRVATWFGYSPRTVHEQWVLRDVSFEVKPGEAVAVIGANGAGKSTLLKLVTGTLRPSEGSVQIGGRVSAILELGMGFNPEFTAHQNILQAAGLMGYTRAQIDEVMPAIKTFAEIGEYFEMPMRTLSSGMQARVAFSLATAWRPDLLIIDEVLSVGDTYFTHKSFDRIRSFRRQGTSILFVSHSMSDVRALCDRAVLISNGRVQKDGLPDEVADYYNALIASKEDELLSVEQRRQKEGWLYTRSGTGVARIESVQLTDPDSGREISLARVGQNLRLSVRVSSNDDLPSLVVGFMIRDRVGNVIWGTNTWHTRQTIIGVRSGQSFEVDLEFVNTLGPGSYAFSVALHQTDNHVDANFEWQDNLITFNVVNTEVPTFIGLCQLDASIAIRSIQ